MDIFSHAHGAHEGHLHGEGNIILSTLEHSLLDLLPMIPLLLITFIAIELMEHKFSSKLQNSIKKAGFLGPILGALIGIIPQCGFSIMAVAFYSKRMISLGTMMAIFLATSDEAIPVLLSMPKSYGILVPFLVLKIVIAATAGYIIDMFISEKNKKLQIACTRETEQVANLCTEVESINYKKVLVHSLERTIKVMLYIYVVMVVISVAVEFIGIEKLSSGIFSGGIMQILAFSIIGLIPNCAISVGIVQLYSVGVISFASVIAGLCSNAGLGLVYLYKESKSIKKSISITILLLGISFLAGSLLYLVDILT
ncbi:MAG: putative manganese transporter [Clostridium sp.]|uniref:putative manganese transporter n=1 Tax=Clostridium sp. TaxID=1506 RepID=UPI002FCA9DF8